MIPTTIAFPPSSSGCSCPHHHERFPCSLPPPSLVLICSSTATVGLTYRETRTVECGNCSPRTRRGEEVRVDDYHMLPSLPIPHTSITIITFSCFFFSFPSTHQFSPTSLFPFWAWVVVSSIGSWKSSFYRNIPCCREKDAVVSDFLAPTPGGRGGGGSVVWVVRTSGMSNVPMN